MSTTLLAFNALLKTFITELAETFPEETALGLYALGFDTLADANPRKPMEFVMAALLPHTDLVMAKDSALFDQDINLGGQIDLRTIWHHDDLSDATRGAIWTYIHTLFLLGTTIQNMPAEMLTNIENVAKDCAARIESGENLDMATMANRKSTRLNSSHVSESRMPSSA